MRRGAMALVAVFALVSCGHDTSHEHAVGNTHTHLDTANGKPDQVIAGPQGGRGQFVVECGFSHAATDDPIIYPGQPGASHEHVFFGNTGTDAASTLVSLEAGQTTCEQRLDRAAYWVPALFAGTAMVEPVKSTAYYRAGLDVEPTVVQPYPSGLMMIAGNAAADTEQPLEVVAWTCGAGIERSALPPVCPPGRNLHLILTFPDCWDGARLDSANHIDHVAYSTGGACPSTHPVAVPQLQFSVEYAHTGPTDGLVLASGGLLSGHADFVNAWDPEKLAGEVQLCLHRNVVCGVTSGRTTG